MVKLALAYVLAFGVGLFCRYFEIPAPAPPVIPGALLVVAMTLGYVVGEKVAPKKAAPENGTAISSTSTPGADKTAK